MFSTSRVIQSLTPRRVAITCKRVGRSSSLSSSNNARSLGFFIFAFTKTLPTSQQLLILDMSSDIEQSARTVLNNRTNVDTDGDALMGIPGPSSTDCNQKSSQISKKRPRSQISRDEVLASQSDLSDKEDGNVVIRRVKVSGRRDVYGLRLRAMSSIAGGSIISESKQMCQNTLVLPLIFYDADSTRSILRSFVSSDKADVFQCYSTDVNSFNTPPYACSYSHGAKHGGTPLLAVATEQGAVHVLNTTRRRDWDPGVCVVEELEVE